MKIGAENKQNHLLWQALGEEGGLSFVFRGRN